MLAKVLKKHLYTPFHNYCIHVLRFTFFISFRRRLKEYSVHQVLRILQVECSTFLLAIVLK